MSHVRDFFNCVKSRHLTVANPEVMHRSMSTVHAANICMWLKRDLRYDPVKEEFPGDAEANRLGPGRAQAVDDLDNRRWYYSRPRLSRSIEANRQRLQAAEHQAVRPPPRPLLVQAQPRHPPHQPSQRNLQLAPARVIPTATCRARGRGHPQGFILVGFPVAMV
jgi:hypothetical protein